MQAQLYDQSELNLPQPADNKAGVSGRTPLCSMQVGLFLFYLMGNFIATAIKP